MKGSCSERDGGGSRPASIDLDAIAFMDRFTCIERWKRQFGHTPPKHMSIQLMRKVFAYEEQLKRFGGHSNVVRRTLKAGLKDRQKEGTASRAKTSAVHLRPGTHLVREWNGRTYQVEVTEDGFRMDGKSYRSLSAIAKKITSAHWSGPRFFGLG